MDNDYRDLVQLRVMGLSYSQIQAGAYALILEQVDGPYRIPVVIGVAEAQSIALRLEKITPSRPMTHDLFVSFAHAFGVKLQRVFIYKFEDGVFSSEITFSDGERNVVIDSRTSDAIAIAMRTHAPIFTTPDILLETGFIMEVSESPDNESQQSAFHNETAEYDPSADMVSEQEPPFEKYTVEQLEKELEQFISREMYEEAAKVSRILKEKKNRRDNQD